MTSKRTTLDPRISVIMTAYNAAAFVGSAIESILTQTFADFEFLIVDDGSTDRTLEIVAGYDDERIRLIRNGKNMGLIASLNLALREARGEYVARMDADDESLPQRFAKQVQFLDARPGIGLCGTAFETMGDRSERWPIECEPKRLKCQLLFDAGIKHPSVMFRRELVERHQLYYDEAFRHAEDYELWTRFVAVTEIANVPSVLLRYRLHSQSVSHINRTWQRQLSDQVRQRMFGTMGLTASEREMDIHISLMRGASHTLAIDVDEAEAWLVRLLAANRMSGYCDHAALSAMLYELWFKLCRAHRHRIRAAGLRFLRSSVAHEMPVPYRLADSGRLFLLQSSRTK